MAATKGNASLLSAVTTTQVSSAVNTSTYYAQSVYVSIAQTSTPATGATFFIEQSPDGGTTYYNGQTYSGPVTATTQYWEIALDPTCTSVKISFTVASSGTSTCTAQVGYISGI